MLIVSSRFNSAAETACTADLDTLRPKANRSLHCLLHGTLVGDALVYLLGDALGYELSIQLRLMDLLDIQLDLFACAFVMPGKEGQGSQLFSRSAVEFRTE